MARKALYLGSDGASFGSIPAQTVDGRSVAIFATTGLDEAVQELIRRNFEWLIVDRPVDEEAVQLLARTAEIDGSQGPHIVVRETLARRHEWTETVVDATFESLGTLELELPEDGDPETAPSESPSHPVLATLRRHDGKRALSHVAADGTYLWANRKFTALLDQPPAEVIGHSVEDVLPPGLDNEDVRSIVQRVLETQDVQWIGSDTVGPVGMYCLYPIDEWSVLIFSYSTEAGIAFGERYLDQIKDLFFIVDFAGNLYYWNDRLNEVTGLTDGQLIDINALELFPPDVRDEVSEKLQSVALYGEQTAELPLVTRTGETVPYQFSGSLVEDADENPQFVCGIGRDISERVEMRREIEEAVEKLEESNAELERFASVASHDLREPLRAVRSYLELLDSRYADDLDDDAREFIEFAVTGAKRMQSMIEDLLEYSRIGSNVRRERVDCEAVIDEVCDNLAVSIEETNAAVHRGNLPAVVADRTLLVQLFQNLIDNAIQHTDKAAPEVTLHAQRADGAWRFAVEDNGPGIPEDDIDDIFEMFSTRNDKNGLGIGLATCRKIVETLGGDIWLETSLGEGSIFYFTLPAREERAIHS